jgi:hypothetical protein
MKAFNDCRKYEDYLIIIDEYIKSNQSKIYPDNANGLSFLTMITDLNEQQKVIKVFRLIDYELSYIGTKTNEMFKKINYLLSTGVLMHDYKNYVEKLNPQELFALIFGKYSRVNDSNKGLLPIFSSKELLNAIINKNEDDIKNKRYNVFGISDFFFMIEEHYKRNPFDTTDEKSVNKFINEMINKINTNTLNENVKNMLEYWESDEMQEIRRSIFK